MPAAPSPPRPRFLVWPHLPAPCQRGRGWGRRRCAGTPSASCRSGWAPRSSPPPPAPAPDRGSAAPANPVTRRRRRRPPRPIPPPEQRRGRAATRLPASPSSPSPASPLGVPERAAGPASLSASLLLLPLAVVAVPPPEGEGERQRRLKAEANGPGEARRLRMPGLYTAPSPPPAGHRSGGRCAGRGTAAPPSGGGSGGWRAPGLAARLLLRVQMSQSDRVPVLKGEWALPWSLPGRSPPPPLSKATPGRSPRHLLWPLLPAAAEVVCRRWAQGLGAQQPAVGWCETTAQASVCECVLRRQVSFEN